MVKREVHTAATPEEVHALGQLIHDWWFDLSDLRWRSTDRLVTFPVRVFVVHERKRALTGWRQETAGAIAGSVTVKHALGLTVDDQADIGRYDIRDLRFDEDIGAVIVRSSFPLSMTISVAAIEVRLMLCTEPT